MDQKTILYKYTYITFVVSLYWLISILMVFVNKTLLSSDTIHLNAPLFIIWFQCVISVIICLLLKSLSKIFGDYIYFPKGSPMSLSIIRKVIPLSLLYTGMIATNSLCLKYVDISFYYVGRSLTTVFNVIFTYSILGEKTSTRVLICCGVIIFGFLLGVDQESVVGSLSVIGTFFGVFSSMILSLYTIHTKKVLPIVNQEIWLLAYYNNFYSILLFLPLIFINGEFDVVYSYDKLKDLDLWIYLTIGGVCGFAIGYVTMLQIKVTSPLTHNISGTAKACVQTVLASYWFDEYKTVLWWLSNFIVLIGSAIYARLKQLDMKREHKKLTNEKTSLL